MRLFTSVVCVLLAKYGAGQDTTETTTIDDITTETIEIYDITTEDITPPSTTPEGESEEVLEEVNLVTIDSFEDFVLVGDVQEESEEDGSGDDGSAEIGSADIGSAEEGSGWVEEGSGWVEEGSSVFIEEEGSAEDVCESDEEDEDTPQEIATYTMTTSNEVGMDIEIQLQRMADGSVQMLCKMEEKITEEDLEVNNSVETTTAAVSGEETTTTDSASQRKVRAVLPATIYMIKDSGVCSDISSAIANDIAANVLELAKITGTGEATEKLPGVTWDDIKQSQCIALLKQKEASDGAEAVGDVTTLASVTAEEAVITTIESVGSGEVTTQEPAASRTYLRRRTPKCIRRRSILQSSSLGRVFTSLSLASYALVSVGFTGAFAVAAVAAQASSSSSSSSSSNTKTDVSFYNQNVTLIFTLGAGVLLVGYYYFLTRSGFFRRRFSDIRRRISSINEHVISARVDAFEDGMVDVMHSVGNALNASPLSLRKIGNQYWKYFKLGPLGSMASIGSNFFRQRRRNWNRKDEVAEPFDNTNYRHEDANEYEYEEQDADEYETYDYDPGFYAHPEKQPEVSHWDDWKF